MWLLSFVGAVGMVIVVPFWANKLGIESSCGGIILTGIVSFVVNYLFLTLAPEALLVPVSLIYVGFILVSIVVNMITGGK